MNDILQCDHLRVECLNPLVGGEAYANIGYLRRFLPHIAVAVSCHSDRENLWVPNRYCCDFRTVRALEMGDLDSINKKSIILKRLIDFLIDYQNFD